MEKIGSDGLEIETSPGLIAKLRLFITKLNPKADIVYYPCSNLDVSPSEFFLAAKFCTSILNPRS